MSGQFQFDFCDFEQAFEMFYRKRLGYEISHNGDIVGKVAGNPKICLVICTASHTSGYWVEESPEQDENSVIYRSVKAVKALENAVKSARKQKETVSLGGLII